MKTILSVRYSVISIVFLIGIWELLFLISDYSPMLFPSPLHALKALIEISKDGSLFVSIGVSLYRFFAGYISACLIAVILGLFLGIYMNLFKYINPSLQLLRPISPTAWTPFIVLLFGIGDIPAIAIIFIAAFFPVLLSTVSAVVNVDQIYFKVAKNFGIFGFSFVSKVLFPAAFPGIANGIRLALGSAWIFLVTGEMVGAQSGLGYQIIDARNEIRADILLATIFVIGLIGLILDTLLKFVEKRILRFWGDIK